MIELTGVVWCDVGEEVGGGRNGFNARIDIMKCTYCLLLTSVLIFL